MNVIIGGGTGLIGVLLIPELIHLGHEITVVGRNKAKIHEQFKNTVHARTWNDLHDLNPDDFDVIVNLSGENIAEHRWSSKIKNELLSSRLEAVKHFIHWGKNAKVKKPHLYNASAVGIYGLQKKLPLEKEVFTEESKNTDLTSFSSQLVNQWEAAALKGIEAGIPVTLMRFGVVLKRGSGMLKKLELPTQFGLGAVVGTGKQPLSWIDSVDLVNAILFLIANPEITGPVNLTAPQYVSQKIFNQTLAQVMGKPSFLRLPAWFVQLVFGQMGEELLVSGQAVSPKRLLEYQFNFKYPTLLSALTQEFT